MAITIPTELEELITKRVESGEYKSADEVVTASLRLLEAREAGLEALRREIMRGVADVQQGRFSTYTADDELDVLSDEIIRRGREGRDASGGR